MTDLQKKGWEGLGGRGPADHRTGTPARQQLVPENPEFLSGILLGSFLLAADLPNMCMATERARGWRAFLQGAGMGRPWPRGTTPPNPTAGEAQLEIFRLDSESGKATGKLPLIPELVGTRLSERLMAWVSCF